ncbi:uncharacterized protein cubi_03140 [Cryptosporidium ubiquitum]|uniref:Signal peptide-containing protein n=1 Tax=Cryptosporidium ubiquitum TaxID=857276 RepID=A0A1J4MLG4_9CRYT|nr:uncharacterized protein cubi_03140 [Cryptosporidium ubiquitum]OII75030.1 hypothetical protein cubi_03140 [Cryptosporidium ubiquitum]
MKISTGLGYLLLLVSQVLCVKAIHSGSPNYQRVYISRKKVPSRTPLPERFRGELYSDGSVDWLSSRRLNGGWTRWAPVSEARVPPHMVRQLKSQLVGIPRRTPQIYRERAISTSPEYSGLGVAPGSYFKPIQSTLHHSEKQFTWEEEDSSHEASPLYLQPISPIPNQTRRSYNPASGRQSVFQLPVIEKRPTPRDISHTYQDRRVFVSPEDELDMARYFEEQNTSPISNKRGIKQTLKEVFKTPLPELELVSPTIRKKAPKNVASPQSQNFQPFQTQQPSDYDLSRMQWRLFLTSFDPRLDNVRIIKPIPPLGMKLSKTVTDCTEYYYKAFKLQYLSISGIMYSKKISRSVNDSINKELKQWCSGMMVNWYRQLQKMGLIVPKPGRFNR